MTEVQAAELLGLIKWLVWGVWLVAVWLGAYVCKRRV